MSSSLELCRSENKTNNKADKVALVKVYLTPMHMLVHQACLKDKVCTASQLNAHLTRSCIIFCTKLAVVDS